MNKILLDHGEAAIVFRNEGDMHVYITPDRITKPDLLVMGIVWALGNEDFKRKLMQRAAEKIKEILGEERAAQARKAADECTSDDDRGHPASMQQSGA